MLPILVAERTLLMVMVVSSSRNESTICCRRRETIGDTTEKRRRGVGYPHGSGGNLGVCTDVLPHLFTAFWLA